MIEIRNDCPVSLDGVYRSRSLLGELFVSDVWFIVLCFPGCDYRVIQRLVKDGDVWRVGSAGRARHYAIVHVKRKQSIWRFKRGLGNPRFVIVDTGFNRRWLSRYLQAVGGVKVE